MNSPLHLHRLMLIFRNSIYFFSLTLWHNIFIKTHSDRLCGGCLISEVEQHGYNLRDNILQHNFNTTLNQSNAIFITLVNITH